jgi:hypothetical protein
MEEHNSLWLFKTLIGTQLLISETLTFAGERLNYWILNDVKTGVVKKKTSSKVTNLASAVDYIRHNRHKPMYGDKLLYSINRGARTLITIS